MAKGTAQDPSNPTSDDLNQQLRQDINDAYAFVQGARTTQTFSALTFEDLMAAQIQTLTAPGTALRPNPLDRVNAIAGRTQDAVAKIKALPDTFFTPRDNTDSTNTPPEGDDPYNGDPTP